MKNIFTSWRTSAAGGTAMGAAFMDLLKTGFDTKSPTFWTNVAAIAAGLVGLLAKDSSVTGGTIHQ